MANTNIKKDGKPGFFARITHSFRAVKSEMKKVVWPTKKQVLNNTLVVLAFVGVCGVFIWGLDSIIHLATNTLFNLL